MQFSLVSTSFNEIASLPRWRSDIAAQTRQPDEIVIVDAESTDGTQEYLRDWADTDPRVRIRIERCNAARGRNLAVSMACHDVVVSTDMGVSIDARWFEEIVLPFESDPSVEIVAGSSAVDPMMLRSAVARAEMYVEDGYTPNLAPGHVPGNRSIAYTKTVWRALGGLPEDLTLYADDSVFGRQMILAGYKMAYAPGAIVYWHRPSRLRQFWAEQFRYGRGDGEANIKKPAAVRWHEQGWLPAWLVPGVHALRNASRFGLAPYWRALRAGDLPALALMPALLLGNGWHCARGYLLGLRHGAIHCRECRARLAHYRGR